MGIVWERVENIENMWKGDVREGSGGVRGNIGEENWVWGGWREME